MNHEFLHESQIGLASVQILEEVERRREMSPALVYPFMRSVMEAPFPAPGRTVTVKSFLPGSGNEVMLTSEEEVFLIASPFCTWLRPHVACSLLGH